MALAIGFPGDDGFPFSRPVLAPMARLVKSERQYDRARPHLIDHRPADIRHLGRHMPQFGRAASLKVTTLHEDATVEVAHWWRNG